MSVDLSVPLDRMRKVVRQPIYGDLPADEVVGYCLLKLGARLYLKGASVGELRTGNGIRISLDRETRSRYER